MQPTKPSISLSLSTTQSNYKGQKSRKKRLYPDNLLKKKVVWPLRASKDTSNCKVTAQNAFIKNIWQPRQLLLPRQQGFKGIEIWQIRLKPSGFDLWFLLFILKTAKCHTKYIYIFCTLQSDNRANFDSVNIFRNPIHSGQTHGFPNYRSALNLRYSFRFQNGYWLIIRC